MSQHRKQPQPQPQPWKNLKYNGRKRKRQKSESIIGIILVTQLLFKLVASKTIGIHPRNVCSGQVMVLFTKKHHSSP